MPEKRFEIKPNSRVYVQTSGDLDVCGWDEPGGRVISRRDNHVQFVVDGDVIRISAGDDCNLYLPKSGSVEIEKVGGDLMGKDIGGAWNIGRVGGDAGLQRIGILNIGTVGGDLTLQKVSGALTIQRIGGDLVGQEILGDLSVTAGGDIEIQGAQGAVIMKAGGDIDLSLEKITGNVSLKAGGDLQVYLPANPDINLQLRSSGEDISLKIGENKQQLDQRNYSVKLGAGTFNITADAGGDITILDEAWDPEDLADHFEEFGEYWDNSKERELDWEESHRHANEKTQRIQERIQRHTEEAMKRAEERVREAMRQVEERTKTFGFPTGMDFTPTPPIPPIPPVPPIPPAWEGSPVDPNPAAEKPAKVSEDERSLILKMLQEKKITAEQAEQLLETLEGLGE